jgi:Annexin
LVRSKQWYLSLILGLDRLSSSLELEHSTQPGRILELSCQALSVLQKRNLALENAKISTPTPAARNSSTKKVEAQENISSLPARQRSFSEIFKAQALGTQITPKQSNESLAMPRSQRTSASEKIHALRVSLGNISAAKAESSSPERPTPQSQSDVEILHASMNGKTSDETAILAIFKGKSPSQIAKLSQAYKTIYCNELYEGICC